MNAQLQKVLEEARLRAAETEATLAEAETQAFNARVLDRFNQAQVVVFQAMADGEAAETEKAEIEAILASLKGEVDDCLGAEIEAKATLADVRTQLKAGQKAMAETEKAMAEAEVAKVKIGAILIKANEALSQIKDEAEKILEAEAEAQRKAQAEEFQRLQAEIEKQAKITAKATLSLWDKVRGIIICSTCGKKVKAGQFCEECGGAL